MGVKIFDLVASRQVELNDLAGKKIAIDAVLFLYQFMSSIRQSDGSPLTDSKGRVTSHLIGLFNRTAKLMQKGIKPCFVFDGKAPKLKREEQERRARIKEEAARKYTTAVQQEDIESMKKYAQRTSRLSKEMIEEAKGLLRAMGLPVIQAPSEGEAQAAQLVKERKVWASASQDADSLLFGSPRLIKNLAITGRKKKKGALSYTIVKPEIIELQDALNALQITQDQLIALGMLVGTDFNVGGIKGIGPKNALKLVRKHPDPDELKREVKWDEHFDVSWEDVFNTFKHMPVHKDQELAWKNIDPKEITRILVDEHDFSAERVKNTLDNLTKEARRKQQKNLRKWFT